MYFVGDASSFRVEVFEISVAAQGRLVFRVALWAKIGNELLEHNCSLLMLQVLITISLFWEVARGAFLRFQLY